MGEGISTTARTRAGLLVTLTAVALLVMACGRASDAEIFSAIGITPTPTQSPEQIATATAAVAAQQTAVAAAVASPGVGGGGAVAMGDITRGGRTFNSNCVQCHSASAAGGDILAPGGPAGALTLETLTVLVRDAPNHAPPGPYQTFQISDRALNDLLAYLVAESST